MTRPDDGGPAFPLSVAVGPSDDTYCSADVSGGVGMSLRDWFAGQALAGMLANGIIPDAFNPWSAAIIRRNDYAASAYEIADAMLRARALSQSPEDSAK